MGSSCRGVAPVIAVILAVAIVVVLAAAIAVPFFGLTENLEESPPNVVDTTGEFEPGVEDQFVQITHVGGDDVDVEEIEIIVQASGPGNNLPNEARLVNLPSDGQGESISNEDIQGDNLIGSSSGDASVIIVEDSNEWGAGDTIEFKINVDASGEGADFRDPAESQSTEADELEVAIIHTPSNAIIYENTFRP